IDRVKFKIHPIQKDPETVVTCVADVFDERIVTDSGGHREQRLIIMTPITIGRWSWPIEVTLTARDNMMFRMLLGRTAIKDIAMVDPSRSYTTGKKPRVKVEKGIK
ncbi:MAG: RimK/LysX family protein, partial [Lysobacterales bacterium]